MKFTTLSSIVFIASGLVAAAVQPGPLRVQVEPKEAPIPDLEIYWAMDHFWWHFEELTSGECYPIDIPGWIIEAHSGGGSCMLFEFTDCTGYNLTVPVPPSPQSYARGYRCTRD